MESLTKAEFIHYLHVCIKFKPEDQDDSDKVKKALHKLLLIIHPDKCKDKYKNKNTCLQKLFKEILKKEDNFLKDDCTKVTKIFLNTFEKHFTEIPLESNNENNWDSDILDLLLIIIFNLCLACKRLNNQPKKSESIKLITGGANKYLIILFSLLVTFVSYFLIMKTLMIIDKTTSDKLDEVGKHFKNEDSTIADTRDLSTFLNHASINLINDFDNPNTNIVDYASNIVNSLIKSDILGIEIPSYIIPSSIIDTFNDAYEKIRKIKEAGETKEAKEATLVKNQLGTILHGMHYFLSEVLDTKDNIKTYLNLKNDDDDDKIKSYSKQFLKNTIENYKISELLEYTLQIYPGLAAYQVVFLSLNQLKNVFWLEEKVDGILDMIKFVDDILQLVIYCNDNYLFDINSITFNYGQMNAIKDQTLSKNSLSNNQYEITTTRDNIVEMTTEIFPEDKVEIMHDFSDLNMNDQVFRKKSNKWFKQMIQNFKNITKNKEIMAKIIKTTIKDFPKDETKNINIHSKSFLEKIHQILKDSGEKMALMGGRIRKTNKNKNKSKNKANKTNKNRKK